ncbi:DUF502 domain-containing protein [Niveibacterium sp. 24ML]|uniref:DUF502 domain-containing protein n=1 Tax=Niveibacterium sp. 24ML TaxID=2985512 RepID=UPI00226ED6EF|nr:DUF502 domain-containing protein [Niveibacterium sp. 24ML]MCX9158459.1 DUF502 domain-containing protein [Niveibacterium sp. 24ML]
MIKRNLKSLAGTWLAGVLALLPITLTIALLGWLFSLINRLIGPGSLVGHSFALVGRGFAEHPVLAYLIGTALLMVAIYFLGLAVQLGLKGPLEQFLDRLLKRVPLVGTVYSTAQRFVGLIDKSGQQADIAAMTPVWCFFGEGGVAVLGLLANPEPVSLKGEDFLAVLVPTAPVPIGGGLIYVRAEWVSPAEVGIERWTSIYVSMGIQAPPSLVARRANA